MKGISDVAGHGLIPLASAVALIVAWSVVALLPGLVTVVPAPWIVFAQMWHDLGFYPRNIAVTAQSAAIGYLIGNAIAVGLVVVTLPFRRIQQLVERVAVGAVALPVGSKLVGQHGLKWV